MANLSPFPVLQQTLQQFLCNWNLGLQPYIDIKTMKDGSIVVRTEVVCSLPAEHPKKKLRHKKSGKASRQRRQDLRNNVNSCTAGKAETSDYESMVASMNSTAIDKPAEEASKISVIEKEALESRRNELEIEIQKKDAQILAFEQQVSGPKLLGYKKPFNHSNVMCADKSNTPSSSASPTATNSCQTTTSTTGLSDVLNSLHAGIKAELAAQTQALANQREQDLENFKKSLSSNFPFR